MAKSIRLYGENAHVDHWNGLKRGDPVIVDGKRHTFFDHVQNVRTGVQWLEVFGGARGYEYVRPVPIDSVQIPSSRRRAS